MAKTVLNWLLSASIFFISSWCLARTPGPTNSLYAGLGGSKAGFAGDLTFNGHNDLTGTGTAGSIYDITTYGADSSGVADSTAAIQSAIDAASAANGLVFAPAGTYKIIPATSKTAASGTVTVGLVMASNLHIECQRGATFRLADNQSTDASPKDLAMFFTNTPISNVTLRGCIFDMNGANNKISPSRPGSYNLFDMAMIRASGDNGRIDDFLAEGNEFINTSGTNEIVLGESNTASITLGTRAQISHNFFHNNGTDTSDNSAVYCWMNNCDVHDNIFLDDTPYGTVGHTGSFTAVELHGSNSVAHDNQITNYLQGFFVANNYTSLAFNQEVHDNQMTVTFTGVSVFNSGASSGGLQDVRIHDNVITLVEQGFTGQPTAQIAFAIEPALTVNNIDIDNNHVNKPGAQTIFPEFAVVVPEAGVTFNNVRFRGNTAINLSQGIGFRTDVGGGSLGYVEATGNLFKNFVSVVGSVPLGVFAAGNNGIGALKIEDNSFVDDQGIHTFQRGIFIQNGTITHLFIGPEIFRNMTVSNYTESNVAVTSRNPDMLRVGNGNELFQSLQSCYLVLSTGQICRVSPGYTETMAGSLTMNKNATGFLFDGSAAITMGTNQIIVSAGTHGISIVGSVPFGGWNFTTGASFTYTGTSNAFQIGTNAATTRVFSMKNIGVNLNGAAGSTALYLTGVVYFDIANFAVAGQNVPGTFGIVCDGTGNFCGTGSISNPMIAFLGTGIFGTGPFANSMNAVTITGGTIQTNVGGGIGLNIDQGDANTVFGTDFESNTTAIRFGSAAINNTVTAARMEANTTDVSGIAGSSNNFVRGLTQANNQLIVSDAGRNNNFQRGSVGPLQVSTATVAASVGSTTLQLPNAANRKYMVTTTAYLVSLGVGCTGSTKVTLTYIYSNNRVGSGAWTVAGWSSQAGAMSNTPILAQNGNGTTVNTIQYMPFNVDTNAVGAAITFATTYSLGTGCTTGPTYYVQVTATEVQ